MVIDKLLMRERCSANIHRASLSYRTWLHNRPQTPDYEVAMCMDCHSPIMIDREGRWRQIPDQQLANYYKHKIAGGRR